MIDTNELRRLAQAVSGWGNCNQAWLDQSEDVQAAVIGHIDEDGNTYPVATIDCDQYYAAHQSLPLAKFYAEANPAAITKLLDRLEVAEKVRDALRAKIERMEKQGPVAYLYEYVSPMDGKTPVWLAGRGEWNGQQAKSAKPLYALPGAQPELNLSDPAIQKQLATQLGYVQKPHPDCDSGCMFQCAQPAPSVPDVDALAQFIRSIDGKNDLGAGALAERIAEWLSAKGAQK